MAADKTWVGGTSSLASEDANWQGGAKPVSGDNIVMSGAVDMTWDLDEITVGDWTQDGYTGTVTFETGEGGTILFDNDDGSHGDAVRDNQGKSYGYTDIVSTNYTTDVKRDFANVTLRLQRGTTVNLLYDLKVRDVEMLTANTELRLNGNTLKVAVREHELIGTVIADGGRIDWWVPGLMIIVR